MAYTFCGQADSCGLAATGAEDVIPLLSTSRSSLRCTPSSTGPTSTRLWPSSRRRPSRAPRSTSSVTISRPRLEPAGADAPEPPCDHRLDDECERARRDRGAHAGVFVEVQETRAGECSFYSVRLPSSSVRGARASVVGIRHAACRMRLRVRLRPRPGRLDGGADPGDVPGRRRLRRRRVGRVVARPGDEAIRRRGSRRNMVVFLGDNDYTESPARSARTGVRPSAGPLGRGSRSPACSATTTTTWTAAGTSSACSECPGRTTRASSATPNSFLLDSNEGGQRADHLARAASSRSRRAIWKIAALPPSAVQGAVDIPERRGTSTERWVPLFERYGVQLVLSGHDHNYQRFVARNGVAYVVHGGGAASLYPLSRCPAAYPPGCARRRARLSLRRGHGGAAGRLGGQHARPGHRPVQPRTGG